MLITRVSALATLMLCLGGSTAAIAEFNRNLPQMIAQAPNEAPGSNRSGPRWIERLDLSADQQQRLEEIRSQYQTRMETQHQEMRQRSQELRELMTSNASDAQLRAKHTEVMTLRQQLAELNFERMLEMREILTDEQRREFAEYMESRHQEGQERWGNSMEGSGRRGQGQPR